MTGRYTDLQIIEDELDATFTNDTEPTEQAVLRYIQEAEARIDDTAGQRYDTQVIEEEVRDFDGQAFINTPSGLNSVQKIEWRSPPSTDWQELDSEDFVVYPQFGRIERNKYKAKNWPVRGQQTLRLSYTLGDSANIPLHIQELATDMVVLKVIKKAVQQEASVAGGDIRVGPITLRGSPSSLVERVRDLKESIKERLASLASAKVYTSYDKEW